MLFLLSAPEKSNLFSGASSGGALYETFIILVSVFPPSPERQTNFPLLCTSQAAVLSIIIRDIKKMDDTARLSHCTKKMALYPEHWTSAHVRSWSSICFHPHLSAPASPVHYPLFQYSQTV